MMTLVHVMGYYFFTPKYSYDFFLYFLYWTDCGKAKQHVQHGLMIRYPLAIFLVPATTYFSPGLMDNELFVILWACT